MKFGILIVKFLFIAALFIVSNENLHLVVSEERDTFFDMYFDWLGSIVIEAQGLTGYVINSEWLPGNVSSPFIDTVG